MQAILFNDMVDMFKNDFIKGKTYIISNGLAKQVNNNFLNVLDSLEFMLYVHSQLRRLQLILIDVSYFYIISSTLRTFSI